MVKVTVKDGGIHKCTRVTSMGIRAEHLAVGGHLINLAQIDTVEMGQTECKKWPHIHMYFNNLCI
jgi:hypothetical protein